MGSPNVFALETTRAGRRLLAIEQHRLAVDDHVVHAGGVLVRLAATTMSLLQCS